MDTLLNKQQMAAWIRSTWQNHLKYIAHNNPEEVLNILSEDYEDDVNFDMEYSDNDVEALVMNIASQCEDPEIFTRQLSDMVPHIGNREGWANIYNY